MTAGLTLAALTTACTERGTELGSVHLKQAPIGKSKGGSLAVTATDCEADEALCPYVGTSIVIPRGALPRDMEIAISVGRSQEGRDGRPNGPALDFGPDGTQFESPVEITLPVGERVARELLRIYVQNGDGTKEVIMPRNIAYDAERGTARFLVSHFTTFQCGTANSPCSDTACPNGNCMIGACSDPCDPTECGPAPGVPSWTCEDGSAGGFNGECGRNADGTCGWVINWCPRVCDPNECGPAPAAPSYQCPDGSVAGPVCRREPNGACAWEFEECDNDCSNTSCGPNEVCDPATGSCQPIATQCGNNVCGAGEWCCNPSCGTCAPLGATCTEQACGGCTDPNGNLNCPPGQQCDPNTNQCVATGVQCGPNVCGDGEYCCNESCGICALPGESCIEPACNDCSLVECAPGHHCVSVPNGTVTCEPNECTDQECGPAPGVPSWICEDGTIGGSTGNCLRNADGTCGWEIIWCPQACSNSECGSPPPTDANDVCQDGSVGAYDCRRVQNGACVWYQTCGDETDPNNGN